MLYLIEVPALTRLPPALLPFLTTLKSVLSEATGVRA